MPDRITALIQIAAVLAFVGIAAVAWLFCHASGRTQPKDPADDDEGNA